VTKSEADGLAAGGVDVSLDRGLQWAVFEPNDEPLLLRVLLSIGNFLIGQWRAGALQGATADEAFVVIRPAGFVILRIGIWTHGAST
jgi:phage tail sheath protein FI